MKIQRFIAPDSRVAMRHVRETFGEDALILSNRQTSDGVEIIAADGSDEMFFGHADQAEIDASTIASAPAEVAAESASPAAIARPESIASEQVVESEPQPVVPEMPDAYARPYTGVGAPDVSERPARPVEAEPEPPVLRHRADRGGAVSPPYNEPVEPFTLSRAMNQTMPKMRRAAPDAAEYARPEASEPEPPVLHDLAGQGECVSPPDNDPIEQSRFSRKLDQTKAKMKRAMPEAKAAEAASPESSQISVMREELARLRGMMESQFSNMHMGLWARNSPARATVLTRMTELGLTEQLAARIVGSLKNIDSVTPQVSTRDALQQLARRIKVTGDKILDEGGVCVFIGPPGAGKTTSIAKTALQFSKRKGSRDIVMISTDTSRIGAHEQLAAYGKLLGVPVIRAADESQVLEIINAMQDKSLVLVDAAGLTQKDLREHGRIPTLGMNIPNLHHYLVMPATAQYQLLDRVMSALPKKRMTGAIITRLDEAANLGEMLSAAIANDFPLAYWTQEQKITSPLQVATQRQLVEKAVALLKTRSGAAASAGAASGAPLQENHLL